MPWVDYTELLLDLEVPPPPDYLEYESTAYTAVEPDWTRFFDPAGELDWRRLVSWGGVPIDGISVLVDPPMEPPSAAAGLADEDLVVGLDVAGDARAYPIRVLNVHEMVHDTVGGSRVALSYCTLCLTAATYLVEDVPGVSGTLDLRTSGLLRRSNKLMYDTATWSLWDQFAGTAVTGPLRGTRLPEVLSSTTTWGEWRRAHPDGMVVVEGAGTGRDYDTDVIADRDSRARSSLSAGSIHDSTHRRP